MYSFLTLAFLPNLTIIAKHNQLILQSPNRSLTLQLPQPGWRVALEQLKNDGITVSELRELILATEDPSELVKFNLELQKLLNQGWLTQAVLPLAKAISMTDSYQFQDQIIPTQALFTLSRFAYLHQVAGEMLLESPLSPTKIILLDWRATALISQLSQPQNCTTLSLAIPGITETLAQEFLSLLLTTQMLTTESEKPPLVFWEFHDLLFHSRSRLGSHNHPMGATYRFQDNLKPLPALKPSRGEKKINLFTPNLDCLLNTDISLSEALESRKSLRKYGKTAITVEQLGEFLYRTARVKEIINTELGQLSRRIYPGGGKIYELEIYPVINTCQNLESGLYYYHPGEHQLTKITPINHDIEALLTSAWLASGQQDRPQILLIITARFGRIYWKYQGFVYALILKHVGVLYQNFYLVATAMNLAPCALGVGNGELFAQATGIDYYQESSVGEFMLGSRLS
ncbi:MAG: SagB/ThcOx family dehydrogenase [Gloeocapsa sp. DLM2.Bin57]|nr:MAG: SagB/ThcOx family dehydrogenase [Gloeocapsa sp. DLM2.Bin57]